MSDGQSNSWLEKLDNSQQAECILYKEVQVQSLAQHGPLRREQGKEGENKRKQKIKEKKTHFQLGADI